MIAIDFSMLSDNRLPRCAYQLANLAEIADRMHLPVKVVITKGQYEQHPILRRVKHLLSDNYRDVKLYIAKSDTFFFDDNWKNIANLPAFKVCLCSSDRLFREKRMMWHGKKSGMGGPVQDRCDLFMPVNCSPELLQDYSYKTIVVAHRPSTQVFDLFTRMHLDFAYLDDDIQTIRDAFKHDVIGLAGFMGRGGYGERRCTDGMPSWVDLVLKADASPAQYLKHLLSYNACVDLRGAGDKSLRFVEAVLFGRTIITKRQVSPYQPPLIDGRNAIVVEKWSDLDSKVDLELWKTISENATKDYLKHWSQLAQFKTILQRAKYGQCNS
jgi:hypothetical protein